MSRLLLLALLLFSTSSYADTLPQFAPVKAELVKPRDGLGNFLSKLRAGQPVKIAYLGGSITSAPGWRVKTRQWFADQYPQAKVDEIQASIGGTGSDLGVFRVDRDALQYQPDLLFVEFAVNDGSAPPEAIWRAMEGIVRKTWAANPQTDICFVYTYRVGFEKELRAGLCPNAASAMEMVADHYGITSVNFALRIVEMEQAGKLVFQSEQPTPKGVVRFSTDGVHPLDEAHQIYADVMAEAMQQIEPLPAVNHQPKLQSSLIKDHWQQAKMVPIAKEMLTGDWKVLPPDAQLAKSFSNRMGTIWEASQPGSKLTIRFRGSILRLYDLLGPDGGQVTITIDGKTRERLVPRFDSYCTYHRLATLSAAEGLAADQEHVAVIEIHPEQPDRSPVAFRLQNPEQELKTDKFQGTRLRVGQILVLGDVLP